MAETLSLTPTTELLSYVKVLLETPLMRIILALTAVVLTVAILTGCGKKPHQTESPDIHKTPTVTGATAGRGNSAPASTLQYGEKKQCTGPFCK